MKRKYRTALVIILAGLFALNNAAFVATAGDDLVTLCHGAGPAGTTRYVTLTISRQAVYGRSGHLTEDGTPQAGHEDDYVGPCTVTAVTPPTPTPTPTPTAAVPTATPTPTPTAAPAAVPSATPTPVALPMPTPLQAAVVLLPPTSGRAVVNPPPAVLLPVTSGAVTAIRLPSTSTAAAPEEAPSNAMLTLGALLVAQGLLILVVLRRWRYE